MIPVDRFKVAALIFVLITFVFTSVPTVAVVTLELVSDSIPALIFVLTILVAVMLVLYTLAEVTKDEKSPLPFTSNVNAGDTLPIPTLPPVVIIEPIVFVLNVAFNPPPDTKSEAVLTLEENRAEPVMSNVVPGEVVPMPTFPFVERYNWFVTPNTIG